MAQVCERAKFGNIKMPYSLPFRAYERKRELVIGFPSKTLPYKRIEIYDIFEPIRVEVCSREVPLRDFRRIIEIEKRVLEKSLEESSLKLCSKLRVSMGLSEKFEADGTALTNLNGFMADLAGEEVDASELVKAARRRL